MNMPSQIDVDAATRNILAKLAMSDPELLLAGLEAAGRLAGEQAAWTRAPTRWSRSPP